MTLYVHWTCIKVNKENVYAWLISGHVEVLYNYNYENVSLCFANINRKSIFNSVVLPAPYPKTGSHSCQGNHHQIVPFP